MEAEIGANQLQSFNTEGTEDTEKNHERFSCPMIAHTPVFSLFLSVSPVTSVLKAFFARVWLEGRRQMI